MVEVISNLYSWVPWLLGFGTIGWVALALLAPSVLSIVSPFLKLGVDIVVDYLRSVWEGFKYVISDTKAVIFTATMLVLALNYQSFTQERQSPRIDSKPAVHKTVTKSKQEDSIFRNPLEWLK